MPFYVLARIPMGELYLMNLLLSDEEAHRYGQKGKMVPVAALVVWTEAETLENFRQFLAVERESQLSPFAQLIREMRSENVAVLELNSVGMEDMLRQAQKPAQFVVLNPGLEQEVLKLEELLERMGGDPVDRRKIVEPDETPKIVGPPVPMFKAVTLNQAVGKTIASVEYGVVEGVPGEVHKGEVMVLHFTDGTALSIEIGSNAQNLASGHPGLKPEDFHTDLMPMWRDREPPQ